MTINEINEDTHRLAVDADTTHEDARGWYESYGWGITTEHAGNVMLQACEYGWLDEDDDTAVRNLMASNHALMAAEAAEIVSMARSVREMAEEVEGLLDVAVEAYRSGDLAATITALEACERREIDGGDSPATQSLADELIDEIDN